MKKASAVILTILVIVITFLVLPAIFFFFGWLAGWVAKITIGKILCNALNILVGSTLFTPTQLPLISGALAWVAGFFASNSVSSSARNR